MKKSLFGLALVTCAATIAAPALATTFPTLTTIYVGSVVRNFGAAEAGVATSFHCTNVSGVTATLRFLVLSGNGEVAGSATLGYAHGVTRTASTHETTFFAEVSLIPGITVSQGGVNIESTESGVFCNAMIVDAAGNPPVPQGITLPLVRVNPHPGTVE